MSKQDVLKALNDLDDDAFFEAVEVLFDGKWQWRKDLTAIGTVLSSVSGLLIAIAALLAAKGVI